MKKPRKHEMETFVDAGFTVADIALYNKWSVAKVRYWLKKYELRAARETGSIGAKAFKALLIHAFPALQIEEEYHIGSRLRLDFYIPSMYTAFEVDGDPHDEMVGLFHGGDKGYDKAQMRDQAKDQWCEENDILLIRITAKLAVETRLDPACRVTVCDMIRDRIAEAAPTGPEIAPEEKRPASKRYTQYMKDMKELSKQRRKEAYRSAKALKDKLKKLQRQ